MKFRRVTALVLTVMMAAAAGCASVPAAPASGSGQEAAGEEAAAEAAEPETAEEETAEAAEEAAPEEAADAEAAEETVEEEAASAESGEEQDLTKTADESEVPALRDSVEKTLGCRIGCAITGSEPWDEGVWNIVTTHFSAVTLGNELKPDALFNYSVSHCPGTEEAELNGETIVVPKLDFSRAEAILDKILAWNEENPDRTIQVRGHVLVWHSQTPEWFFHEDYIKSKPYVTPEEMNKRLEWYIRTVLTHFTGEDSRYKDLFYGWDVVNEAISDATGSYRSDAENPSEPLSQDRHGSNSSWWHVYQSEEYILNAFLYANKYAPASLELYYNDYNECDVRKRNGILKLLTAVKELEGAPGEGTRIDAMGMQGHYHLTTPNSTAVSASIKAYGDVVGNVQITEWDMRASDGFDGSEESLAEEYEKQRKVYNLEYYALKAAQNAGDANITGITFWGTIDPYSWLQTFSGVGGGNTTGLSQCPLLFDGNYQPKPAFFVFAAEP
ncbi:MAG: endo-1,4-beta-xylanase [Lachnospiraceae bacterium]|nr:endo-1,4-beta-xylanase [Lachnospiraceae bacterium]